MYIDLLGDWPAYVFMVVFVVFISYVIVKSLKGAQDVSMDAQQKAKPKK
jgi:hypothetical protein